MKIQHKATGETKIVTENEYFAMIDDRDWIIVSARARDEKGQLKADDPKTAKNEAYEDGIGPKPTEKSSVAVIKKYLNAKGIKFTGTHNTKAKLLKLI